jgi:uncharacterized membrane protein
MSDYPANTPATGFDLNRPTVVALLQLLGIVTIGLVSIIAVILAYQWRDDPQTQAWERTHHRYHIRTFWYSLALAAAGAVTVIIGVGVLILALIGVYVGVRAVLSLTNAQKRLPVPNPEAFLW